MLAWVEIQKQLWSVKACPANLHGWFWVLALPLVVAPPNLQNQLTWTSEGTLNYYGFNWSLQNASVGGEGLEKYNPGKSICNERLDHYSQCNHIRKRSTLHRFIQKSHELIDRCAAESTHPLFAPPRTFSLVRYWKRWGLCSRDPAKTTARTFAPILGQMGLLATSLNVTNRSLRLVLPRLCLVCGADRRRHIALTLELFLLLLSSIGEESTWSSGKDFREVCTSGRRRVHARLSGEVRGIFVRCVSEAQFAPVDRK